MRYAQIRSLDISNGEGCGVALFTQGCHFHCHNCFNRETWDFNGGKEWNDETCNKLLGLLNRDYIPRLSILGGEPLHDNNLKSLCELVHKIRAMFGDKKKIWVYSGFLWEFIMNDSPSRELTEKEKEMLYLRKEIVKNCDVLVDGRYVEELADMNYKWAGSTNQRVIDIQKSLTQDKIVLWQ